MKKDFFKILLILLLALTACKKSDDSSSGSLDILGLSDQTDEAAKIIISANGDLRQIKVIYKDNENSVQELEAAINDHDIDKVKKISGDLVDKINAGMALGESAISKIDDAENLKINDTYRNYLDLKKEALRKQVAAFELRRQSAVLLRDGFGGKDKLEVERIKGALKDREDSFKKAMQVAREMSEEANQIAKDSLKK